MTFASLLVACDQASVTLAGRKALDGVTFRLERGQTWLVLGQNGSGKSTLLRLLRGDIWPDDDGVGRRLFFPDQGVNQGPGRASPLGLRHRFGLVSPERARTLTRLGGHLTAGACILAGARDSLYVQGPPTAPEARRRDALLDRLDLGRLADLPVSALSNGQLRAVLLARALMREPLALFLDEFLDGLDATAEVLAARAVAGAAAAGAAVVLTSHRPLHLPVEAAQALVLDRGRVTDSGPVDQVLARQPRPVRPAATAATSELATIACATPATGSPGLPLVVVENATVVREGRVALAGVSLTVRPGEHLALLGANGSGKSTLFGLIAGEHHPAAGGRISRPGLAAPEGLTDLREIRRRLGLVSFELEAAYEKEVTGLELVLSGFSASIGLYADPEPGQVEQARQWLTRLDAADLAERCLGGLSAGQTRRLFLARAMVAGPRLLLLDEPFAALDDASRREAMATVSRLARSGVTVLCAVHQREDIIPEIRIVRRLDRGRLLPATAV